MIVQLISSTYLSYVILIYLSLFRWSADMHYAPMRTGEAGSEITISWKMISMVSSWNEKRALWKERSFWNPKLWPQLRQLFHYLPNSVRSADMSMVLAAPLCTPPMPPVTKIWKQTSKKYYDRLSFIYSPDRDLYGSERNSCELPASSQVAVFETLRSIKHLQELFCFKFFLIISTWREQ